MIAPTSERLLKALTALDGRPEFVVFVEWIKQSQQDTDLALRESVPEVTVRQEQGAAQTLAALLGTVSRSRTLLEDLQQRQSRKP